MKQLIWDLPTRLFHWSFAFSITIAFSLAHLAHKETPLFYAHIAFGILAGLLLIWRIIWGFAGSYHARFAQIIFSPIEIINYFKSIVSGQGKYYAGHNPGSSLAIWGMYGLASLTIISGLLMGFSESFEEVHEVFPNLMMFIVSFHIIGVLLASKTHKESYALSMIHGKKTAESKDAISHNYFLAGIIMVVFVFGGWGYFLKGYDFNTASFQAPGTHFKMQFGEAEDNEDSHMESNTNENGNVKNKESDEKENDRDDD